MTATKKALTRARRGAAFLDGKLGRGWRRKIRRRKLDMAETDYRTGCGCILAQLAPDGSYTTGLKSVGLEDKYARHARQRQLGFDNDGGDTDYDDLTDAWLEVLRS